MFCLNATMPIFLTMMLGYAFRKWHIMDGAFVDKMNSFVFKVALPVLVFQDLATVDFFEAWDWKFVVFCFFATLISITAVTLLSFLLKDKSLQGEFIQASYRSSAAIFGIAFIQNIYGEAGMGPLMIVASVPLYNIMAVVVLTVMRPVILAVLLKLVILASVFLPIAVTLGFRTEKLIAILVMLGSATTDSSYVMARNMGHKGVLTSSVVMLTTLLSAFTLTGWLYLLKVQGLV